MELLGPNVSDETHQCGHWESDLKLSLASRRSLKDGQSSVRARYVKRADPNAKRRLSGPNESARATKDNCRFLILFMRSAHVA